jgi:hypothetical protein
MYLALVITHKSFSQLSEARILPKNVHSAVPKRASDVAGVGIHRDVGNHQIWPPCIISNCGYNVCMSTEQTSFTSVERNTQRSATN